MARTDDRPADSEWTLLAEKHPILARLPLQLKAEAAKKCFVAGDLLFRRGTRPKAMLFVVAGEVRLVRHTAAGRQVILQRSRSGFIAEASMEAKAYHCDILAAEEGSVVLFPVQGFRHALDESREFRQMWVSQLAGEVRRLRAQSERMHLGRAADRIVHYLESEGRSGVVTLTQSRKAWAAELGLSHEALYRALARMQAEGVISLCSETISLLGPGD